ncbi:serine/threonine protein kinase [Actinomadura sp. NAK00032]|nr:serine/threonine protein kinase [Actinomadura sp. NAK00032]
MAGPEPLDAADPTRLGGWELLARLGAGGQGSVYLGRPVDPASGPPRVAVKLLHARLLGDADARERFVRELALLQRVAGFCTAQMLAADTAGDRPYIVSEYVPGPSLRALVLAEGPRAGAGLDRLAISSVTALSAIHRANVAHRDLKPQNVLMGPDGPRVIDFGIARAFAAGATLTSQVVGTPAYMAPEQFAGRAGPAADLFAWAGTLLFAATGRDPFAGGPLPAVMYRILHETPDLRALPAPSPRSPPPAWPRTRPTAPPPRTSSSGSSAHAPPTPRPNPSPPPPRRLASPHRQKPPHHPSPPPCRGLPRHPKPPRSRVLPRHPEPPRCRVLPCHPVLPHRRGLRRRRVLPRCRDLVRCRVLPCHRVLACCRSLPGCRVLGRCRGLPRCRRPGRRGASTRPRGSRGRPRPQAVGGCGSGRPWGVGWCSRGCSRRSTSPRWRSSSPGRRSARGTGAGCCPWWRRRSRSSPWSRSSR